MTKNPKQDKQQVIAPDKDFRNVIEANAQAAWLDYCKGNGLDPNANNTDRKED